MRVIIMGCGRVGVQLSRLLDEEGHSVVVIDQDAHSLENLGAGFRGRKVKGVGFDRDVLVKAGIEQADAFAATSASDNANIISARIARQVFRVPHVVARLYDPRRAEIYRRLGLLTISSTTWGAERIRELLTHAELDPVAAFGNGEVSLVSLTVHQPLIGRQVRNITIPGEIQVATITRQGQAFIPMTGTEFQDGDVIHLLLLSSSMDRLKAMLGINEGE